MRLKIIEKIIDDLKVEMPEILVEVELDKFYIVWNPTSLKWG